MIVTQEFTQSVEEAIAENNRRFADTATRSNARAMASVYAIDADLLPPNAEAVRGPAAIERFWEGSFEMGIRGIEPETLRLVQVEGLAYEIGRYTLHFGARGRRSGDPTSPPPRDLSGKALGESSGDEVRRILSLPVNRY